MADDERDARRVSRTGARRLSARRPRAVAGVPRRAAARPRVVRRRHGRPAHRLRARPGRAGRRPALQRRRRRPPRARARLRAEGEAAHLQRVLRGAHVLARRPRPGARRGRRCRSATTCSSSTSAPWAWRCARTRGRRMARCVAAASSGAEIIVNVSASPVSHGHRRHAARDAGHARRRQPDGAGLRQRRRRARTASSTTAAGSSSRTAGSCTKRRASPSARPRRSSISTARGACAWNTRPGAPTASITCAASARWR